MSTRDEVDVSQAVLLREIPSLFQMQVSKIVTVYMQTVLLYYTEYQPIAAFVIWAWLAEIGQSWQVDGRAAVV